MLVEDTEGTAENNGISYDEGDSVVNPENSGKAIKKIDLITDKGNRQLHSLRD